MKKFSQVFAAALIAVGMFSCNVIDITKKRYSNGYYVSSSMNRKVETQDNIVKERKYDIMLESKVDEITEIPTTDLATTITTQETIADNAVSTKKKSIHKKKKALLSQNKPVFAVKSGKFSLSSVQMQEQKLINKTAHNNRKASDVDLLLLVILAILLPPLAVFLKRGLDSMFWISLILTLLFWFPGAIFALLVVFDVI